MTGPDGPAAGEPPAEPPPEGADLRFTEHARDTVRVSRDLSAEGHLARGDRTRMSRLNFTARARPADPAERDAAFTARPPEPAPRPASAEADDGPDPPAA